MARKMKRRRRSVRFGASSEKHAELIPKEGELAATMADDALIDIRRSVCGRALRSIRTAAHAHGVMFAHIMALPGADRARHDPRYDHVAKKIENALVAYEEKCDRTRRR